MFVRNGEALGSVLHSAVPGAKQPKPPEPAELASEQEADLQAAQSRERPKDYDTKAEWVDYAVSKGADPGEAEESTKADLIELYGGDE